MCAKHFAVHSGPEKDRHILDPHVSLRELNDTYFPGLSSNWYRMQKSKQ